MSQSGNPNPVQALNIVVTANGFAKITNALLTNSNISIAYFKIGSSYGFVPSGTDIAVHNEIFTQTDSHQMKAILMNPDTIDFKITIGPLLGPMTIGNIGLYLADNTLFALAVLTEPDFQVP